MVICDLLNWYSARNKQYLYESSMDLDGKRNMFPEFNNVQQDLWIYKLCGLELLMQE